MYLLGTHGTSKSRADAIVDGKKFRPSSGGYVGHGAYFWAYESDEDYGVGLAKCWWALAHNTGEYKNDVDQACAVISAKIVRPKDEEFLDATQLFFREALFKVIRQKSLTVKNVPEVTAWLIDEIQEQENKQFMVIKALVTTPRLVRKQTINAAQVVCGTSESYVVKAIGLHLIKDIKLV